MTSSALPDRAACCHRVVDSPVVSHQPVAQQVVQVQDLRHVQGRDTELLNVVNCSPVVSHQQVVQVQDLRHMQCRYIELMSVVNSAVVSHQPVAQQVIQIQDLRHVKCRYIERMTSSTVR